MMSERLPDVVILCSAPQALWLYKCICVHACTILPMKTMPISDTSDTVGWFESKTQSLKMAPGSVSPIV